MKNWDEYMLNEIDEKIKIVGASSPPDRAGIRIGGGDFPLPLQHFLIQLFISL